MGPNVGEEIIGDIDPKMGVDTDGTSILFWVETFVMLLVAGLTIRVFVTSYVGSLADLVTATLERVVMNLLLYRAID